MTWSIVARDPESGLFGIAIASRFLAVGAMCPGAEARVGAVSTQALMDPTFAPRSLGLMRGGVRPDDVCRMMIAADEGADQRQLHMIDRDGRSAAHTGANCVDWCGHRHETNLSVAGNMLAGPAVVEDTFAMFRSRTDLPICERLFEAMDAGEAAGGDKRGKQSAALLVQGDEPYPRLSLRVDDHADPLAELRRLYDVAKERFIPFSTCFPTPDRPHGITDREFLETIIERDIGKPLRPLADIPMP